MKKTTNRQPPTANYFPIAAITSAHGIRGEVKLRCFLQNPADLPRYAPLITAQGKPLSLTVTGQQKDQLIARIDGVADRNAAEALKGSELFAARDKLPPKAPSEFYLHELTGLTVLDAAGNALGKVASVANFGAGDLLDVTFDDGSSEYFSFDARTFPATDLKAGTITLVRPEEI